MTPLAAFAAAGLVARLAAAAPPPLDVTIEGDVTYQAGSGAILVENGAVLRRGAVTIRARTATYDPATGEVHATGGVLLTDPTRVVQADAVRAVLDGEWEAQGVVAFVKDQPVDLGAVDTLDAARGRGRNRLSFSGGRLDGEPSGRFHLSDARLTLCDCPGGCAPSWEVTASKADVVPGKRAILSWPVLRITPRFLFVNADRVPGLRPIPVLVLPWLYLPLGDRQTGLLLPAFRQNSAEGWVLSQPLFVTLGRSWDATLTGEYAFGKDAGAIRGPGAALELRWAPALHAEGRVQLDWLHDLQREDRGVGGDRLALAGAHRQRVGDRGGVVAQLALAGDPVWVRDHHPTGTVGWTNYRRSAALASLRGDRWVVEGDAGFLQPLRPSGTDPRRWRALGADDRVANRWPALAASLLPGGEGPLELSGRLGAVRYAPVSGGVDAAGRPATSRADGRLQLSAPLVLGGALSVAPYLRGAAAGYAFEGGGSSLASAWAVAGLVTSTELSRRFGALRHAIQPQLEWRGGTAPAGERLPWPAWDAVDRTGTELLASGPPGAWHQLRASIATRLVRGGDELARLELGQDLDTRRGRFAESFVSAGGGAGGISASASARFYGIDAREGVIVAPASTSRFLDRFTELRASIGAADARGDSLGVGFSSVGPGGSSTLVAGADPIFDTRPVKFDVASASLNGSARAVLGPATLGYDIALYGRSGDYPCGDGNIRVEALRPVGHRASFVWNSPCRCFRIVAFATRNACGHFGGDVSIDISRLVSGTPRTP